MTLALFLCQALSHRRAHLKARFMHEDSVIKCEPDLVGSQGPWGIPPKVSLGDAFS